MGAAEDLVQDLVVGLVDKSHLLVGILHHHHGVQVSSEIDTGSGCPGSIVIFQEGDGWGRTVGEFGVHSERTRS
jgi:hypothetical protein